MLLPSITSLQLTNYENRDLQAFFIRFGSGFQHLGKSAGVGNKAHILLLML